jgi:RNA polymerase sigma-70 factor (ECF subfamily)
MASHTGVSADLVLQIPELRAFAISLCRSTDQSEDLVQDTLLSAWAHLDDFKEGTNLGAWLTTILRNRFVNIYRKQRLHREVIGSGQIEAAATVPNQDGWAISTDLGNALEQLPDHQRAAVLLVGADGLSLAEAATICDCEVGTIKSRVSRARERLSTLLADDDAAAPCRLRRRSAPRRPRLMPHGSNGPRRAHPGGSLPRLRAAPATRS